ncbi:MAG: SDR family oxidoreductase [Gammaproteobacteria bacterium]|nr:SDR family oxidoreductase [Gammaproteobacteria bacterium]
MAGTFAQTGFQNLSGRVAVVTGAGSGIGHAIVKEFLSADMRVFGWDIGFTAETPADAAKRAVLDVRDEARVREEMRHVMDECQTLDVLVNCAGIGGINRTKYLDTDTWNSMLTTHVNGTFVCTREALHTMEAKRRGKIINVASICGITGCECAAHYSAAKGAVIGFTKALAREAIKRGIHVNAIAPGYVETPLLAVLNTEQRDAILSAIPLGRFGTAAEIASLALYLISDAANFMVGQVISPNGGQVI